MTLDTWLSKLPSVKQRSTLISLIKIAMAKTGKSPEPSRREIHEIHTRHLTNMAIVDFPRHFEEIVLVLLMMTDEHEVDPDVWFDLLNATLNFGCRGVLQTKDSFQANMEKFWSSTFQDFAKNQSQFQICEVTDVIKHFSNKFFNERKVIGVHGIYTKYKDYVPGLAAMFSLFGHLYVKQRELMPMQSKTAYIPANERKPMKFRGNLRILRIV
jgi:hypothetical protein